MDCSYSVGVIHAVRVPCQRKLGAFHRRGELGNDGPHVHDITPSVPNNASRTTFRGERYYAVLAMGNAG
jgi:hypothetical protein